MRPGARFNDFASFLVDLIAHSITMCKVCTNLIKFAYSDVTPLGVVHKGRPQKRPLFLPPVLECPHLITPPLRTSAFSIIHCSMVRQCNSWCCQSTLLIELIIGAFSANPVAVYMWVM